MEAPSDSDCYSSYYSQSLELVNAITTAPFQYLKGEKYQMSMDTELDCAWWQRWHGYTYYIPTTVFVFASDSFNPNILAIPKSDIFASPFLLVKILDYHWD